MNSFLVETNEKSWIENRNGIVDISHVEVWGNGTVYLQGVSRAKEVTVRGGISMNEDAFLNMCAKGLGKSTMYVLSLDLPESDLVPTFAGWTPGDAMDAAISSCSSEMNDEEKELMMVRPEEAFDRFVHRIHGRWMLLTVRLPDFPVSE